MRLEMSAINDAFKVLVVRHGNGWDAIHVGLAHWHRPKAHIDDPTIIALSFEDTQPDHFEATVDDLIRQLEALKADGRKALARIAKRE
jgi:hypothetical protein